MTGGGQSSDLCLPHGHLSCLQLSQVYARVVTSKTNGHYAFINVCLFVLNRWQLFTVKQVTQQGFFVCQTTNERNLSISASQKENLQNYALDVDYCCEWEHSMLQNLFLTVSLGITLGKLLNH